MTEHTTQIPNNGRERLVFISPDGTWHEPADDDTHLPAREAAVLLALLHLAVEKRYAYDFKTRCMLPGWSEDLTSVVPRSSDPLVTESLAELQRLTTCECDAAWTDRGLHERHCTAEFREDVDTLAAALTHAPSPEQRT